MQRAPDCAAEPRSVTGSSRAPGIPACLSPLSQANPVEEGITLINLLSQGPPLTFQSEMMALLTPVPCEAFSALSWLPASILRGVPAPQIPFLCSGKGPELLAGRAPPNGGGSLGKMLREPASRIPHSDFWEAWTEGRCKACHKAVVQGQLRPSSLELLIMYLISGDFDMFLNSNNNKSLGKIYFFSL